jgi:uncharacterized protein (TIGR01777 family)
VRVVVTGGTGFVGRALVGALVARQDSVTVLTRDPARARLPAGVTAVAWGGADRGWRDAVQASDAVVHLAGESVADGRWTAERLERMRASRVQTGAAIAEVIAAARVKPAWISASAVGIYGMRKDDDVVDERGDHGTDELASICEAWEASTLPARKAGARVAIPRLGIVMGKGGGALEKMLPPFRLGVGGPLGDGRQWLSWVHIDDVVAALLYAVDRADLDGPFNVTAPKPVTMNDFAHALAHALHRPCVMRVPAFALKVALGDGLARTLLTGQRAVPARLERGGFTFRYQDVAPALESLVAS